MSLSRNPAPVRRNHLSSMTYHVYANTNHNVIAEQTDTWHIHEKSLSKALPNSRAIETSYGQLRMVKHRSTLRLPSYRKTLHYAFGKKGKSRKRIATLQFTEFENLNASRRPPRAARKGSNSSCHQVLRTACADHLFLQQASQQSSRSTHPTISEMHLRNSETLLFDLAGWVVFKA